MTKKRQIKIKKRTDLPEGAVSFGTINKIGEVHLTRILDEDGASDLLPVLVPFSEGKILEQAGQMKRAREMFKSILKTNPRNRWAIEALRQVEMNLQ
jgi:hypothetical protein